MDDFGMHDLMQRQINESCHLALPDGLQDLMYDISREVLRAQPPNVYAFIANYLSALLVTRENLGVASKLCSDVCKNICHMGLKGDLLEIGLTEEQVDTVHDIVEEYFGAGHVKEENLLMKLMKKTDIKEDLLQDIQLVIRRAFLRYQTNNTTIYESSSDSEMDEVTRAARHTMKLHRQTRPTDYEMNRAATRIQAAYRAYGVRREKVSAQVSKPTSKTIRFGTFSNIDSDQCSVILSENGSTSNVPQYYPPPEHTDSYNSEISKMVLHPSLLFKEPSLSVSSSSLAGSFIKLPKTVPYSAHDKDVLHEMDEISEIEKEGTIDYTTLIEKNNSSHKQETCEISSVESFILNDEESDDSDESDTDYQNVRNFDNAAIPEVIDEDDDAMEVTDQTDAKDKVQPPPPSENEEVLEEGDTKDTIFFENDNLEIPPEELTEHNDTTITDDMDKLLDEIDKSI